MNIERSIGAQEAADLLGISKSYLLKLCREHSIPHQRLGKRVLFTVTSLVGWRNREIQSSSPSALVPVE